MWQRSVEFLDWLDLWSLISDPVDLWFNVEKKNRGREKKHHVLVFCTVHMYFVQYIRVQYMCFIRFYNKLVKCNVNITDDLAKGFRCMI